MPTGVSLCRKPTIIWTWSQRYFLLTKCKQPFHSAKACIFLQNFQGIWSLNHHIKALRRRNAHHGEYVYQPTHFHFILTSLIVSLPNSSGSIAYCGQQRLWSDCAVIQADLLLFSLYMTSHSFLFCWQYCKSCTGSGVWENLYSEIY